MSLADPNVFVTEHDDGSADFTVTIDDEDFKFSASLVDDKEAVLSYEETLTFRGQIQVSEPRNEIFKLLIQSDEMTEYLESNDIEKIIRERHE